MSVAKPYDVQKALDKALRDDFVRNATRRATSRLRNSKQTATDQLGDWEEWRQAGEKIRNHVIENLDFYLKQLIENVEKNGGHVHIARTPADAVKAVQEISQKHKAKTVVKSKSMISEEIHLNPALEADGIEVTETDLAEYIIQIANETPSHIIVPAMHKNRDQIAKLLEPIAGHPLSSDTPTLTRFVREKLRKKFLEADIGINGCNFAVADTGTVTMVTNEGNGRMVTTLPKVQITLMGMERIVPSYRELSVVLNLLARSATGQRLSVYTTMLTPPIHEGDLDGPEEWHLVILDHNRSEILGDQDFKPSLRCIRCGACFNVCPVYRQVGGHAYGSVYSGPIGVVLTPLLEQDYDQWGHLPYFCSLCAACSEACPVKIPLDDLIVRHRDRKVTTGHTPAIEPTIFHAYSYLFARPKLLRHFLHIGAHFQGVLMKNGYIVRGPKPLSNWTSRKYLPALSHKLFEDQWPTLDKDQERNRQQRGDPK